MTDLRQAAPGVYVVPLGSVNAYLVDSDGLTLVDTGPPGSAEQIEDAIRALGRHPSELRQILVTHLHADHAGSLAAVKQRTGAPAFMHAEDARMVRAGRCARPMHPPPGMLRRLRYRALVQHARQQIDPSDVELEIADGDELPVAAGMRVVHAPGHTAGQVAFLWPHHGGVLFAADAASNVLGQLDWSVAYEDVELGRRSLATLSALEFAVACFGHGPPITERASESFRKKWGDARA